MHTASILGGLPSSPHLYIYSNWVRIFEIITTQSSGFLSTGGHGDIRVYRSLLWSHADDVVLVDVEDFNKDNTLGVGRLAC
jgi:hypothetical protein